MSEETAKRNRRAAWRYTPVDWDEWGGNPENIIGVLRYDGDPDVFAAAAQLALRAGGHTYSVMPPEYRWFRWSPDPTGEYRQLLMPMACSARGGWQGSFVRLGRDFWTPADFPITFGPAAGVQK